MSAHERNLVILNHRGGRRDQYQAEWAKLDAGRVYDLLLACKHSCRSQAADLRRRLRGHTWTIVAAPHEGGKGGQGRTPDRNLHITIRVSGRGFHLRLGGREGNLHISSITH